jgi:hypothetical protein
MSRDAAWFFFLPCVLALALASGCAAPGEPTARHPITPVAVSDLTGHQTGAAVVLTFTLPRKSTDDSPLPESPAIEIYRAPLSPDVAPDRKTPWRLVYTIPYERVDSYLSGDRIEFRDPLAPADIGGVDGHQMAYMVRTRSVKARASGDSNYFTMQISPPPDAPRNLRAAVTEIAVVLSWTEPMASGNSPKTSSYRVYRAELGPGQEAAGDASQAKYKSPLAFQGSPSSPEFSDTQFDFGHTYLYVVRAVSQMGAESAGSVESADSTPVILTPKDTFPPATPTGLEAGIIPATPEAPARVELSWAISSEGDLAGYFVYRSDREDTPGERISRETLPSPTFRDISVASGKRYFYRVSAVDRAGNESPLSPVVQIDVP